MSLNYPRVTNFTVMSVAHHYLFKTEVNAMTKRTLWFPVYFGKYTIFAEIWLFFTINLIFEPLWSINLNYEHLYTNTTIKFHSYDRKNAMIRCIFAEIWLFFTINLIFEPLWSINLNYEHLYIRPPLNSTAMTEKTQWFAAYLLIYMAIFHN